MAKNPAPEPIVFGVQQPSERIALWGRTLPPARLQPAREQPIQLFHATPTTPAQLLELKFVVHTLRATISFLISAMALAGFNPFGQVRAQFMMV